MDHPVEDSFPPSPSAPPSTLATALPPSTLVFSPDPSPPPAPASAPEPKRRKKRNELELLFQSGAEMLRGKRSREAYSLNIRQFSLTSLGRSELIRLEVSHVGLSRMHNKSTYSKAGGTRALKRRSLQRALILTDGATQVT